jgi:hypothetical protein
MSVFVTVKKKSESKRTGVTQTPWYQSRVKGAVHTLMFLNDNAKEKRTKIRLNINIQFDMLHVSCVN